MVKKRTLKRYGKTAAIPSELLRSIRVVKEFLDNLPVDEIRTVKELAEELGYSRKSLQSLIDLGPAYRYLEGCTYIYANPKTIKLQRKGAYRE